MPTVTKRVILLAIALVSITGLVLIYLHVEIRRTVQFARQNPTQRPWWLRTPSLEEAITHTPSPSTETNGTPEEGTPPPLIPTTVTFREGVSIYDRATLEAMGATLLQGLDGLHAIYGIPDSLRDQVASLSFVAELAPPNPQEKISSEVRELFEEDPSSPASLTVFFFQDTDEKDAINAVRTAGLSTTDTSYREGHWVIATGTQDQVTRLIEDPRVYQVWREQPKAGPCNRDAAELSRVPPVYLSGSIGPGLSGSGVRLAMWDAGNVRETHQELTAARVTNVEEGEVSDHATHVAGTIIASGIDPRAKGMAFEATLKTYTFANGLREWRNNTDCEIANNSWGYCTGWSFNPETDPQWIWGGGGGPYQSEDPKFGKYTPACREADLATERDEILQVCAAGNTLAYQGPANSEAPHWHVKNRLELYRYCNRHIQGGYPDGLDSLPEFSSAKNTFVVGAVDANKNLASFSSRGLTDDGRIKPDVVAKGVDLYSCGIESDDSYALKSGTSMATPVVTGVCGLLLQMLNSPGYLREGQRIPKSLIRALVAHTAEDLGLPGPDAKYGWGLVDASAAVTLLQRDVNEGTWSFMKTEVLPNASVISFRFYSDGTEPFRATLCWADPAGRGNTADCDDRTPAVVHNLDLYVIAPDHVIYYPWKLDADHPDLLATRGMNNVDTIERVDVPTPLEGTYTVYVKHQGTLIYAQLFSLVTNARTNHAPPIPAVPRELSPAAGTSVPGPVCQLQLSWSPSRNALYYELTVINPAGESTVYRPFWNRQIISIPPTAGTYHWSVRAVNQGRISGAAESTFNRTVSEYRGRRSRYR